MPPEPLPWDRKHDRFSESLRSLSRWTQTPHHAPYRTPAGEGKQGGWHMFSEESGPGGDGKYSRNNRETRVSFNQRDWKGNSWGNDASPNGHDRINYNIDSHPHSDFVNTWDHLKEQNDKNGGVSGLGGHNSMDWKPLKWTRSGSLSSRGSGFSHSSSSKSMGVDSLEMKPEAHLRNATPVRSPSGDAAACVTSAAPIEETSSRKKPRLGWGEGLAKYEKKKVEGPDDTAAKNGMVTCTNTEPLHISDVADKSPRVVSYLECSSPATPSSVACGSSPGLEDKPFIKAANVDTGTSKFSASTCPVPQNHSESLAFNLEKLELTPVPNLSFSLSELLKSDDPSSLDSDFMRTTAMNKLLVLKADISKALEVTETEIDLLENEWKSLNSDSVSGRPCPATLNSLPVVCKPNPCEELCASPNVISRPAPLQQLLSGVMIMAKTVGAQEEEHAGVKDEDIDSPGTATSKFVEPLPVEKAVFLSDTEKHGDCSQNAYLCRHDNFEGECSVYGVNEEKTCAVSTCGDDGIQLKTRNSFSTLSTDVDVYCDREEDTLYDLLSTSNRDAARRASEVFIKLLPSNQCWGDTSRAVSRLWGEDDSLVKEKFAMRKRLLKFKERVITLKFRAFQHLWREDLRLLSIRRYGEKSQKRFELSLRTVLSEKSQKHRSSVRSRFTSPAGNLSLVPTSDIINFTSKLLSDSDVQIYRSALKMPSLILDRKEMIISRFISNNGLVEDPCTVEKEKYMINPWTSEEKKIFMEKFDTCGKDFRKIASFLDHKTTADCVEFYYKNHKSDCFQKTKKNPEFAKQGKSYSSSTYLVTSGKKWNRETNAASLDILGAASAIAAANVDGMGNQLKCTSNFFGVPGDYKTPKRGEGGTLERSDSVNVFGNERETVAADVLAGICGSLSSEAMSSCVTTSLDPGEAQQERKCARVGPSIRQPLSPDITQSIDDETCSDESCGEMMDPSDWTDEEKSIFVQALSSYGKDFKMIARCVGTRSRDQCKVFFSKARKCLGLDLMWYGSRDEGTRTGDDTNEGGGNDAEDVACIVEESGSKMDEDLHLSDLKVNHNESDPAGTVNLHPDLNQLEENNGTVEVDFKDTEPKSEKLNSDDCEADEKQEVDFDGDSTEDSVGCEPPVAVQTHENSVILSGVEAGENKADENVTLEESVSAGETKDLCLPIISGTGIETEVVDEVSVEYSRTELAGFSGRGLNDAIISDSNCLVKNSNSAPQSVGNAAPIAPYSFHMSSTLDFEKISNKQCQKSAKTDDYHQGLSGQHSLLDPVESSQILRGYPVSVPTKKQMDGNINCKKPASLQNISKLDRNSLRNDYLPQDCYLRKCNSPKPPDSVAEAQFLSTEQMKDFAKPQPLSSSDEAKPCRSGDVKLFGQIITHSESHHNHKLNHSTQEDEERGAEHSKLSGNSFNLKFNGNHNDSAPPIDCRNYLGFENLPASSYGFWDGSRIQTGFPSLPDSAILLAKYPAAFSNFPVSSSKMEGQPLHSAVVKGNGCNLTGVSFFPTREISSSNRVTDYQVYRSRDGVKLQPFAVDLKHRQEILFSDVQRRSEIDLVSSTIQQQAKGVVGINVVGRGRGILVGGPRTVVSDPVAAIKMHYAKTEQYSGQAGSIIREEESWRGKGDIGR